MSKIIVHRSLQETQRSAKRSSDGTHSLVRTSPSYQRPCESSRFSKHSILIVDDHPLFRKGLKQIIEEQLDLVICGEADNTIDAVKVVREMKPEMAIIDLSLQGADNGMDLIRQILERDPKIRILVLSMHDEAIYGQRVLSAGAKGYVMKQSASDVLILAIRRLLSGEIYASQTVLNQLINKIVGPRHQTENSPMDRLSDRELEIFRLIGQGVKNIQIADKLCISVSTVETYQAHIKKKLGLNNANELLQCAIHWTAKDQQMV